MKNLNNSNKKLNNKKQQRKKKNQHKREKKMKENRDFRANLKVLSKVIQRSHQE